MKLKPGIFNGQFGNIMKKSLPDRRTAYMDLPTRKEISEQSQLGANLETTYAEMHSSRRRVSA